jgi:hypothetical protein
VEHEGRHSEPQGAAESATNASPAEPDAPATSDVVAQIDLLIAAVPDLPLPDQIEVFESAHRTLTDLLSEHDT